LAVLTVGLGIALVLVVMLLRRVTGLKESGQQDVALGLIKQDIQGINQTLTERLDKSSEVMREAINRQFAASSAIDW